MRLCTVLDTETTGKLDPAHRVIELCMRCCDLDTGEEIKNLLYRFNPKRNIDAKAFAVHGIALDELKSEPTFCEKAESIKRILASSYIVVGHNIEWFDKPFLENEFRNCKIEPPEYKVFDTMVRGTFATDFGKSPNLQEFCWALGVDYNPTAAHSGSYDTLVLRDAFFEAIRLGWFVL